MVMQMANKKEEQPLEKGVPLLQALSVQFFGGESPSEGELEDN
jgi:hypothetical protein